MLSTEITRIKPSEKWISLELKELWAYRELLYFLTWRDVKIRYKQTAIGILWAVLQPVLTTAIFTVLFGIFARFDTGAVPYPLFALSGLMVWLFVHNSISMASTSFVNNTSLVTKVYFPRLVVPVAASLAGLFDLIFSIAILAGLMAYYAVLPGSEILLAPIFLFLAVVQAVSLGTLFSALNVRFRDVKFALPFLLQVWMIASPVFYPSTILPEKWRLVFALNPLTGILEGFRSSLFGEPFDWPVIWVSVASLAAIATISLLIFKRMEDEFADVI
ncbi:MAG TPA: ABC transporter permease [Pyrinomonadaceae bacterium]|nr:ABC transporter permease [Pyrinomonadaceae bacterium]